MTATSQPDNLLNGLSAALTDVAERAAVSVVRLDGNRSPATGVVIAPDLVLTVDHLLDREDDLRLHASDGRVVTATFAGRDPSTDLALLRAPDLKGTAARRAAAQPRPGELALSVARSTSGEVILSFGLMAGMRGPLRSSRGPALDEVIRVEAFSSPGFTGGLLVNARGEALGVVNAALVRGVRLAIPAARAWQIGEAIAARGSISRGYLGIASQVVAIPAAQRGDRAHEQGLLVVGVAPESPANRAGVYLGDIIIEFDRAAVRDPAELLASLTPDRVGRTATLTVLRGGAVRELDVKIGSRD